MRYKTKLQGKVARYLYEFKNTHLLTEKNTFKYSEQLANKIINLVKYGKVKKKSKVNE